MVHIKGYNNSKINQTLYSRVQPEVFGAGSESLSGAFNNTDITYQLITYVTDTYLCGELRASKDLTVKYHIKSEDEHFVKTQNGVYRRGKVYRICIDKATGDEISNELIRSNNAKVMYDASNIICKEEF